ncbi:MAG: NUDIX domain-containing protein [Patescibacteria group bacterium]
MDLEIDIKGTFLNIKVVILVKTKNGFILEKSPNGYFYFVGGRVKINETSEEAAKREIFEEIGIKIEELTFKTIIENFFTLKENQHVHEICFVYTIDHKLEINDLASNYVECPITNFENTDIRPRALKDYILTNDDRPHIIYRNL